MTTVVIERAKLEQVREALENGKKVRSAEGGTKYQPDLEDKAFAILTEALAQPEQEPVGQVGDEYGTVNWFLFLLPDGTMIYASPPQRKPDQPAPVQPDRTGMTYYKNDACKAKDAHSPDCVCWTPTQQQSPVQQKPLFKKLIDQHPGLAEELKALAEQPAQQEPAVLQAFTRSSNGPNPFYTCDTCGLSFRLLVKAQQHTPAPVESDLGTKEAK